MYNSITPMGSSHPYQRDGQSSRRKEISRLSELKCKTIAYKAEVFFYLSIRMFMKAFVVFRLVDMIMLTSYILLLIWQLVRRNIGKSRRDSTSNPIST